jgi:zinc transport system ATP-binding protein
MTINSGDYLCIVGENGSGKSTLLSGLVRLLKPLSGSVIYGADFSLNSVGYLSQAAAAKKDFPAGAREIVLSGFLGKMGWRPFFTREEKRIAAEYMERTHSADLRSRCFRELSGGQQRRVLLARALCAAYTPSASALLALDEPAAGLDPEAADSLYRLLASLNAPSPAGGAGVTIVMVTHDIDAAQKYAGAILRLEAGAPCGEVS